MIGRAVTVVLQDGTYLTAKCPEWCVTEHLDGEFREDFVHRSVEQSLHVQTWLHGRYGILAVVLIEAPFALDHRLRRILATVDLGGEWVEMREPELLSIAQGLEEHAGLLRRTAGLLQAMRGEQ